MFLSHSLNKPAHNVSFEIQNALQKKLLESRELWIKYKNFFWIISKNFFFAHKF